MNSPQGGGEKWIHIIRALTYVGAFLISKSRMLGRS